MSRSNPALVLFLVLVASVIGGLAARTIPSAVFPEIQFNRAIILADAGDLPATQMLVTVTQPLEQAAYGVIGVSLVRSTTTRGSSEIDVTFLEGSDAVATFQLLSGAVAQIRATLPANAHLDTRLLTTGTFPIIDVSLSSPIRGLAELTDIAQYELAPSLHRIAGVYRVELDGAKQREFVVRLDPAQMLQHGLTAADVAAGLARANVIEAAGRVDDAHRAVLTVVRGDLHDREQLAALSVATVNHQPVFLRDVAQVELGIVEDYIRTADEKGPAVLVGVSRQPAGNTVEISAQAHAIIDEFRARYPDVQFSFSYDQAGLVTESFNSVRDAIVLGLALAVVIVFLFTWSFLNALVAAVVVPGTIAITFAVMKLTGMTFNLMTLGGLAAGIGLFIDDAIVMIESIHRAHSGGDRGAASLADALRELTRPLIASTATVIVVFAPLVFVSGVTGVFFRALALTLGSGLFISLLLALFFTPAFELLIERWRRPARPGGRTAELITKLYLLSVRPFLRAPILAPILAALALAATFLLYRTIGTDYLPALDEGAFILDYMTPAQSTLADTQHLLEQIESVLKTTPEVAAFARRTGTQLGFFLTESNRGDISVRLKTARTRDIYAVIDAVRGRISRTLPNVTIEFSQVLQDLIGDLSGTPEPVAIKVFGSDQATIETTAGTIAARLRGIPGLVDVKSGLVLSNPEADVVVDQTALARYGLNAADVVATLKTAIEGNVATEITMGDRLYGVRVRYPADFRQNLTLLPEVLMRTPDGGLVPLSSLMTLVWKGERTELDRERLRAVVDVTARVDQTDLGTAIARIKANLAGFALSPGVTLEYGGLYAEQQKAFHQLTLVLLAAIVAMFLVLLWEFGRLTPAVAIMLSALASLAGSFAALTLTGLTLNISSFMGIIMVAGITAKNGILLLDHAERSTAPDGRTALIEAAQIRFRPILMTTLATAAGLLPLALGLGAGAKVQQPLAVAVIGGLVFALLLSTSLAGGIYLMGGAPRGDKEN
ncbi:MAG TPA: efflux RND transporter permease subunit [Candidatus Binataceae bacterium]|nr:efflux RND transporter permease subunit [Candidatus Binataceae bacterium]